MNALQKQDLTYQQTEVLRQFQPIVVDTAELKRIETYLTHTAKFARGRSKTVMFVNIRTGRLDHKSLHHFILKGLPRRFQGLTQVLKIENYETRLKAMQQLEAYTRIFMEGRFNGQVITQFEQITPKMLTEKMIEIQKNKSLYQ